MYQKRFLNGEEGSGSDQEEDEESKAQTKSKTVVMHFKRKAKAKAVDPNELRKRRAGRVNLDQSDDDRLDEYSEEGSSYTESEEDEYGHRRRVRRKRQRRRRKGSKNRSKSKERSLSLEKAVETERMYDYYLDQSKGITKKAENDRGKLTRLLDLVKQIRLYDLKRIRNKELEDTNLNLTGLKKNWTGVKASLQTKVKFVEDIQRRHREEIQTYEEFCDYLEPGSLKDKIKLQI